MATKILIKKSSTSGGAPLTSDLDQGEFAVNLADRKIYTKDNSNAIVTINGAYVDSVAPANPAEGDLWYDTANNLLKSHNGSAFVSAGYTTLDTLENVTITANSSGEILVWNGAAWVNNTLSEAGIQPAGSYAAAIHTHDASDITSGTFADARIAQSNVTQHQAALSITESQISDLGAYLTGITGENIESLSNVTVTSIASGEILKWNGSAWVNNTLAEAGIQPAGSYLTAESDTLASVTGRGATTATDISLTSTTTSTTDTTGALTVAGGVGIAENLNVGGNAVIDGNLTVSGTTTTVNSNEVNIGDSIILLNSDETGVPSQNGGIEIERGTEVNKSFLWDETSDVWSLGNETLADVIIDGGSY